MSAFLFRPTIAGTASAVLLATAVITATASPASARPGAPASVPTSQALATAIARENLTLLPRLFAHGGTLTGDGRFVRMPGGTEISVAPMAFSDCPTGYLCLWSDASWSGRMTRALGPNIRVNLVDSNSFDNVMTSWANRSAAYDARWFYNANQSGTTRCMNVNSSSANVGTTDNDQASSIAVYTDANACT